MLRLKAGARPGFYVELIGGIVVANVHLLKDKSERVKYDLSNVRLAVTEHSVLPASKQSAFSCVLGAAFS